MPYEVITHASEVLTGVGIRKKDGRRVQEEDLGRILDGALVYKTKRIGLKEVPDRIEWVGQTSDLPKKWMKQRRKSLKHEQAIIPGLVDCHNHLIFAGDRAEEFAARCGGATYEEIAKNGGGILKTVYATRAASEIELERLGSSRLKELYQRGVRTVEVKSGYGLSVDAELKILNVVIRLRKKFPQMTLTSTFLGAHAFPPDQSREGYIRDLIEVLLPLIKNKKLADSCDVFIDQGYYTINDGQKILKAAQQLGFQIKVHADELVNTESATLAVKLGALSADHLLKVSDSGIQALAGSSTVAVLLPGTAFYLKANQAPARKLLNAGACVALATDFNPGTSPCLSLPAVMTIAALYLGMTRSEIFAAVTYNAAKALGLNSRKGTLDLGRDADFWIVPFSKFDEIYYRFAW